MVTQPKSYDIADIEYFSLQEDLSVTGVLQPMDVKKIKFYDKIVPLFITGKLTPDSTIAQGTAPNTVSFVESAGGEDLRRRSPRSWMTMIPTIYNADTLGIRPDLVGRPIANWKDLMDPAFKGRTARS